MNEWKRRLIAWLGLALITLNFAIAPALPTTMPEDRGAGVDAAFIGDALCLTRATIPVTDDEGRTSQQPTHATLCQLCLPLLHGCLTTAPMGWTLAAPDYVLALVEAPQVESPAASVLARPTPHSPRAPPHFL